MSLQRCSDENSAWIWSKLLERCVLWLDWHSVITSTYVAINPWINNYYIMHILAMEYGYYTCVLGY